MSGDRLNLIRSGPNSKGREDEDGFMPLSTLPVAIFQLLATVAVVVAAWLVPSYLDVDSNPSPLPTLLYIQTGLWAIHLLAYCYKNAKHEESRRNGYLDMYPVFSKWGKTDLAVVSITKVVLVSVLGVLWDNCPEIEACSEYVHLTPIHYIQLIISLEGILVLITLVTYITYVWRFNHQKPLPDVFQEEALHSSVHSFRTLQDTGYRENSLEDLLQKQAETIRYLKEHNAILNAKVLTLTQQLNHVDHA